MGLFVAIQSDFDQSISEFSTLIPPPLSPDSNDASASLLQKNLPACALFSLLSSLLFSFSSSHDHRKELNSLFLSLSPRHRSPKAATQLFTNMGQPSQPASNALIYTTYAVFLFVLPCLPARSSCSQERIVLANRFHAASAVSSSHGLSVIKPKANTSPRCEHRRVRENKPSPGDSCPLIAAEREK